MLQIRVKIGKKKMTKNKNNELKIVVDLLFICLCVTKIPIDTAKERMKVKNVRK